MKNLLHSFKYRQKTYLRHFFVEQMIRFVEQRSLDIHQFDMIIPVPLFSSRFRERGYNQSFLLAKDISTYFNIPLQTAHIRRTLNTLHQAQLPQKERWTNIKGAFTITHSSTFRGRSVLIVDDLLTTGATLSELAKSLKSVGALRVGALTLSIAKEY